jgi:hypothetical protein
VRELLPDYQDGALSGDEAEVVRGHLAICANCNRVWCRYQDTLAALRQLAPTAEEGMAAHRWRRISRRMGPWRGLRRPGPVLGALAASLIVALALSVVLFQRRSPVSRAAKTTPAAPACVELLQGLWRVDVMGLRAPLPEPIPKTRLRLDREELTLPALLIRHGPYEVAVDEARGAGDAVCVPLLAPFGDVLVLSIADAGAMRDGASRFRAASDPARVLYTRIAWTSGGRLWRLEGRAPAGDLEALAKEIDAQARRAGS